MRTLVLCVDRDDDLGEKAKVSSPVLGRKDNLRAVIALGLEDPEDSDANVIFMGLKLLKKYRDMGREVEIATICGDRMVGMQSDANLIRQFYAVLEQFAPDTVVLVSDGAEDEVILPLISQRVQIEHIARVVVKQQQNLESTYYILMSAFKNPKIGKKIIVPLSLMLMLWGILMVLGFVGVAIGLMITIFSIFLLMKALNIEDQITRVFDDLRDAMRTRRYLLFSGVIVSVILIMTGVVVGFLKAEPEEEVLEFAYIFLKNVWPFILVAAIIYTLGNSLDTYFRTGRFVRSTGVILLSLSAIGFITYTTVEFLGYALNLQSDFDIWKNLPSFIAGLILLFVSGMVFIYNRGKSGGGRKVGWLR
jgi:putative membrane protein